MKAVKVEIEVYRGDTYQRGFQWREYNVAVDMTACTLKMQFRTCVGSDTVLLEATSAAGKLAITDAINGGWEIRLPAADTLALAVGRYVYDVKVTFPNTTINTVIRGTVNVIERITV